MSANLSTQEFKLFRDLIERECGIALQEEKMYLIESRLTSLMFENNCNTFLEFFEKISRDAAGNLKNKIIDAMTTNETLWFRDNGPYKVMEELLYPELNNALKTLSRRQVRIWSAACSTGQEPYSIGIIAHEFARKTGNTEIIGPGRLDIVATDISDSALTIARHAKYNPLAMSRGMQPDIKARYFEDQGPLSILKPQIQNMVKFSQFNLQRPFDMMGKFDVIFLRNVAIYFSQAFKQELFTKLANSLNPGGCLFLGSSETLIGFNTPFKRLEHNGCPYYKI